MPSLILISKARVALSSGRAVEIRKRARLSQSEVARAIGVESQTVCRWESGRRQPRGETAARYARLLEMLERQAKAIEAIERQAKASAG